jgi:hypothetical protein
MARISVHNSSLSALECDEFRKTEAANESHYVPCGSREVGVNSLICMSATVGVAHAILSRAKAKT